MKKLVVFSVIMVFLLMFAIQSKSQHHPQHNTPHADLHAVHNHHFSVFGGLTSNLHAEHTDFSIGADYEFRLPSLNHKLGIGLLGDFVFAEYSEMILAVPAFVHPFGNFKFLLAPGIVRAEEHMGKFSISPTFNLDIINGHTSLVYGFTFGRGL